MRGVAILKLGSKTLWADFVAIRGNVLRRIYALQNVMNKGKQTRKIKDILSMLPSSSCFALFSPM